jgi:thioredoxin-dependent peroxiredoxin
MAERTGLVTLKGNPLTLVGNEVKVGQPAPDATITANDLSDVQLSSLLKGKRTIISVVPSLDTPVCDLQTKRFNKEAASLGDDVQIITVSMDLPFAQKRWCGATGSDKIKVFSDHRQASFGNAFGVLIKNLQLLARSIFIVDENGKVQYTQIVKEVASEPDYDAALQALKKPAMAKK